MRALGRSDLAAAVSVATFTDEEMVLMLDYHSGILAQQALQYDTS